MLYCHGDKFYDEREKVYSSYFHFESAEKDGMMERFSEHDLVDLLKDMVCMVKLVVLSACHS
jgi:hypothetical protein